MKLSTILLITTAVLGLTTITVYNFSLKASYQMGNYKNRFFGMERTDTKGINELDIKAANRIKMNVESGEMEGLWIRDQVKDKIRISKEGNVLTIDLTDEAKSKGEVLDEYDIILISNEIRTLSLASYFTRRQIERGDFYNSQSVLLKGLNMDSLTLHIGKFAAVYLEQVKVRTLNAVVGEQTGETSLTIDSLSEIGSADLKVQGISNLVLNNPKILKTTYHLSDDATVTLSGKALQSIRK